MQLKQLKIKNMRSFTDEVIDFPLGTTLLAGSIGAGKSTILLAIEFALFGITKEMSGAALLRNGAEKGSVELTLSVDKKEVTIKRSLKRGSSVTQEAGYLVINNAMREATATELRQAVLSLLNYPQEFLTKSPATIYRYTVYTPQEEMKHILLSSKEDRLAILRRIFGIDKYKIIKENAEMFIANIKARTKEFAIAIADLESKRREEKEKERELEEGEKKLQQILPRLEKIKESLREEKKRCVLLEEEIKKVQEIKKAHALCESEIQHKLKEISRIKARSTMLEEGIKELEKEVMQEEKEEGERECKEKEKMIQELEKECREIVRKIQEKKTIVQQSEKMLWEMQQLDTCPLCKQNVSPQHKHKVKSEEEKKIEEHGKAMQELQAREREKEQETQEKKREWEELKKKIQHKMVMNLKRENYNAKKKEQKELQEELVQVKREIGMLNTQKNEWELKGKESENLEEIYRNVRERVEELREQEKKDAIAYASTEKEKENILHVKEKLRNEIMQKEKVLEKIGRLKNLQQWLENQFIAMVATIEKQMMLRIYTDFNAFFQRWFEMIIDTEKIRVRIDEEFSSVIEQNGYSIEYIHLSGGEKTAVALAYRLALNQIMNTLMNAIKTQDLLILDEPTDGFSSEQLDRLRSVFEELDAKQIIMVSHESKIESLVQNVIRLEKKEHTSAVVGQ